MQSVRRKSLLCTKAWHNAMQDNETDGHGKKGWELFSVRASAQGSLCALRTFGPYHQQNFGRPRRISGTRNSEVSETLISAFDFAWSLRRFIYIFCGDVVLESVYNYRQKSAAAKMDFAKFEYRTRPYEKIYSDLWTPFRNRKICRKYEVSL